MHEDEIFLCLFHPFTVDKIDFIFISILYTFFLYFSLHISKFFSNLSQIFLKGSNCYSKDQRHEKFYKYFPDKSQCKFLDRKAFKIIKKRKIKSS